MKRNIMIRDQKLNNEYLNYLKGNYENLNNGLSENDLVNSRNARRKMIGKDIILDKVKRLIMVKELDCCNVKMVAQYFEVPYDTVKSVIKNNREELVENGMKIVSGKEINNIIKSIYDMKYNGGSINNYPLAQNQSGFVYDNQSFNNGKNILLNRRCILNIAMLLRDSIVAKQIRYELLNVEERYNVVLLEKERLDYNNYNNKRLYDEIIESRNIIEKRYNDARDEIQQYIKKESMVESFINYIIALNKITYKEYEDYMNRFK